ncbi:hypothetical protein BJ322DRAFT_287211 [Thelephora terrestris]|uniref:F-box domain-containing protein n=1 Tax=Thelephora terrestris TaxID=56493 RepID=A0A9P6H982_9AGAM|nr:hypothetical protein BJ322DRAFT_287211 [Thelephora terrestris]
MTYNKAEVVTLEHDALQVLSLIRSVKNTFAPINKVPPDVLTLIPDYWEDSDMDQNLISLTHVCRSWREIFTLRPSLWARLDCTDVDKTRVYIERSRSFPLAVYISDDEDDSRWEEPFLLVVPHINRIKTLSVVAVTSQVIPVLVKNLSCRLPFLEEIVFDMEDYPLPDELFNGDLSTVRELSLGGVLTSLPWKNMSNLTTFTLHGIPKDAILLTQMLNFFESAPHIRDVHLHDSIPSSSDAPVERVVCLPHLEKLEIIAQPAHSILLNHLSIPAGASLSLEFSFSGGESPIPSYLPKSSDGLLNLSHITLINLFFGLGKRFVRLKGPSGELQILGNWTRGDDKPNTGTGSFLRSLRSQFDLSGCRWLVIQRCCFKPPSGSVTASIVYNTLLSLKNLSSLTLVRCHNLNFILALNPKENPSGTLLCPKLEEITLYIKDPDDLRVDELLGMVKGRASRDAKLSVIMVVSTGTLAPTKDVFQLRKHVSHVECKFDDALPEWDALPAQAM